MTPYHYAIVRCRDGAIHGEWRNVAVLVVGPSERRACVRRARLGERAHLEGDNAAFVATLLDDLEAQAGEVVAGGDAAEAHAWLASRAGRTEDGLSLSRPGVGVADDLAVEVLRLGRLYLGEDAAEPR